MISYTVDTSIAFLVSNPFNDQAPFVIGTPPRSRINGPDPCGDREESSRGDRYVGYVRGQWKDLLFEVHRIWRSDGNDVLYLALVCLRNHKTLRERERERDTRVFVTDFLGCFQEATRFPRSHTLINTPMLFI